MPSAWLAAARMRGKQTSRIPLKLFDRAEALGPVEILVNNAAFWHGDTFLPDRAERFWMAPDAGLAGTCGRHFAVNSRASELRIAEFARRHCARGVS